jgi:WD40 repeat protein
MVFSADGNLIAGVSRGRDGYKLRLWSRRTGKHQLDFEKSYGYQGVAGEVKFHFSPDGRTLASGGLNHGGMPKPDIVKLWDVATGRLTHTLVARQGFRDIAFSPDSRMIAVVGSSAGTKPVRGGIAISRNRGEVSLWNVNTGNRMRTLSGLPSSGTTAAFSPDGKSLAIAHDMAPVSIINVATGKVTRTVPYPPSIGSGHHAPMSMNVHQLAYSPDGKVLAAADYRAVHLWNAVSGQFIKTVELMSPPMYSSGLDVGGIAVSPDSQSIAVAGKNVRTVTIAAVL